MTAQSTRIVLIYADTGGGHRSTAQAIATALRAQYGDGIQTELVNATPYMPYPFNQAEHWYPVAIAHARGAYALFWHVTNNKLYAHAAQSAMHATGTRHISRFFAQHPADAYVSCHPLVNQLLPATAKQRCPGTPFLAVVSDMVTVHALFWSQNLDHIMVPTRQAKALAVHDGIRPEQITVTGQPVLPDFAERARRGRTLRASLALAPDTPTVLLMGGGDGMGRMLETAQAIGRSGLPLQLVVACGRNESARAALMHAQHCTPVHAIGFTDNVPEYMGASDVLVTKAGPGAICEAFVAGLPVVLYDAVPGQESGNVDLVVQSGAGIWRPTPAAVVEQLRTWIDDPAARQRAAHASLANARPEAALNVARLIVNFARRAARHGDAAHSIAQGRSSSPFGASSA